MTKCKKHKVIISLNKLLTENVLNWTPSYFVTAAVLPDETSFQLQNREQRFPDHRELPWFDVHCMVHWCIVLHENRVTKLKPLRKQ